MTERRNCSERSVAGMETSAGFTTTVESDCNGLIELLEHLFLEHGKSAFEKIYGVRSVKGGAVLFFEGSFRGLA